jgi:hypothetical protein
VSENSSALELAEPPQNAILRYSRLQICATPNTSPAWLLRLATAHTIRRL